VNRNGEQHVFLSTIKLKKQREISPVQLLFKCSMFHTQGLLSSKRVEIAMNTISRKQKFTKLGTIQGRGDGPKASTS